MTYEDRASPPGPSLVWLEKRLDAIELQMTEQHQRLRSDMYAGFDKVAAKLDQHADDDAKVANRVLVIETNIAAEERQAVKRGTWAGLLAAFGLTAGWELVQKIWRP
jgi:hypothetical protein